MIRLHENMMESLRPSPVIAIALNTYDLNDHDAQEAIDLIAAETGLPTTDPVRFAPGPIAEAIGAFHLDRVGVIS